MTREPGGSDFAGLRATVLSGLRLIGTALLAATFGAIFLPIITFFVAMIAAGLTSNCGAGRSGGCEMWAGGLAIASVPVWAAIAFALGIYGGLKSP